MKNLFRSLLCIGVFALTYCTTQAQSGYTTLNAKDFKMLIEKDRSTQVVDVRSENEFSQGHILDALLYSWDDPEFETNIKVLDKSKPVYLYCLSGGRSVAAAKKLHQMGFKEVITLEGGLMKWRAEGYPEVGRIDRKHLAMPMENFNKVIHDNQKVLVDFYADWCVPCRKMEPYIKELAAEMGDKLVVLRIDADQNPDLLSSLKVDELPTLILYQNGKQTWKNAGYITKDKVQAKVK